MLGARCGYVSPPVSVDSKTKERIKLTPVDFGDGLTENIAELEARLEGVTTAIQTS